MAHQAASTETTILGWGWLYKIGGVAALTTGTLLSIGMLSLIASVLVPGIASGGFALFRDNWLVKIFLQHAGFSGIPSNLYGLNLLDTLILLLVSVLCLSLITSFKKAGKVWSIIAFVLSVAAIALFAVTQIAGRSTVMFAVLINSLVMFGDKTWSKTTLYLGIIASVLLFVGDLTVGMHSDIITILFAGGYVLLTAWFFLIGVRLVGRAARA